MKTTHLKLAAVCLIGFAAGAAQAQVTIGGSIGINVPGIYGRVEIGPQPGMAYVPPEVVYEQPVVIAPSAYAVRQRPIYLYVPDGYERDWAHHCGAYRACGQPVFFVRDQWVRDRYVQRYPDDHRFDNGRGYRGDSDHRHDGYEGEHDHHDHGGEGRHGDHDRGDGDGDGDRDEHGHGHGHGGDRR